MAETKTKAAASNAADNKVAKKGAKSAKSALKHKRPVKVKTPGRVKSGRNWKSKNIERATKTYVSKNEMNKKTSFDQRMTKKRDLQSIKDHDAEMRERVAVRRRVRAKQLKAKRARKTEDEIKSGSYQIIKKTDKIRKWHKNARRQLVTMSEEQMKTLIHEKARKWLNVAHAD